jgi:hypothetical protein
MSSKNTFYFSHDANAHEDPKIVCLMSDYGAQGYGWWWILVEILFQQEGCKLDLSKQSTLPYLQRMMWDADKPQIKQFIESCVEYGLLVQDGDLIFSESLLKRNQKLDELREKRRAAANARWNKDKDKKETIEQPVVKESSGGIAVLKDQGKWAEFVSEVNVPEVYRVIPIKVLINEKDRCLDWLEANGKRKKDYKAFFRNWLKKHLENNRYDNNGQKMVY